MLWTLCDEGFVIACPKNLCSLFLTMMFRKSLNIFLQHIGLKLQVSEESVVILNSPVFRVFYSLFVKLSLLVIKNFYLSHYL